ncbi:MAG: iron ABC transporter permease [Pseudomonadota bacterium]
MIASFTQCVHRYVLVPIKSHRLATFALAFAVLLFMPLLALTASVFATDNGTIAHMARTVLLEFATNTLLLVVFVGFGVTVVGTSTAWLVAMCEFPGRRFFEWALIVPLAIPAYILAYAYTDLLSHPGLVQSSLRELTGWGPRDYWFPEIRSLGGAAIMFIFVLYPYVYLLARTAFLEQSTCYTEVSRSLGYGPVQTFAYISLPLARPAVVGGVTLALMETLADFGTVAHFAVRTFTTGIYRAWLSMDDSVAAAQLSTMLLGVVLTVIVIERLTRRSARYHNSRRLRALPAYRLSPALGWLAAGVCTLPVLLGFVIPLLVLANLAWITDEGPPWSRYVTLSTNSIILAGTAAVVTVSVAIFFTYAARLDPGRISTAAVRIGNLGYAVPGSIIAVAILIPFAAFDNALDAAMRSAFGISTGLILTGTITALVMAYVIRFLAVALGGVEAGLARIPATMDAAARSLGETQATMLRRVHLPLLRPALLTALLMVFVDVMKELPATLIMRPFNFDTLAIQTYRLASDERLAQAATPALILVAVGLGPVILLSRRIMTSRRRDRVQTQAGIPETAIAAATQNR